MALDTPLRSVKYSKNILKSTPCSGPGDKTKRGRSIEFNRSVKQSNIILYCDPIYNNNKGGNQSKIERVKEPRQIQKTVKIFMVFTILKLVKLLTIWIAPNEYLHNVGQARWLTHECNVLSNKNISHYSARLQGCINTCSGTVTFRGF